MFESFGDIDDDDFLSGVLENEDNLVVNNKKLGSNLAEDIYTPNPNNLLRDRDREPSGAKNVEYSNNSDVFRPNFILEKSSSLELHKDGFTHSNKDNKRKLVDPPLPLSSKRERKFPGPAGLLPDPKASRVIPLKLDSILDAENSPPKPTPDELCSQGCCSGTVLEGEPWQRMLADLEPNTHILEVVNIASVKRKAAARCFVGKKVPFLAAVLHHLDVSSPDPCIILRDITGEIHGTLHREIWEKFAGELIIGSVLIIKNVGLLSTGISSRRHYLNITANNLVTIYSANSDTIRKSSLPSFEAQDFNQIIENWRSLINPSHGVASPASMGSPSLFSSSLCSSLTNSPVQISASSTSKEILSRRPVTDQPFKSNHQSPNIRLNNAQNHQFSSNSKCILESSPRHMVSSKALGRNLLPSFISNSNQQCVNSVTCNSLSSSSHFSNVNQNKSFKCQIENSPSVKPNGQSTPNGFKFNPVIPRTGTLNLFPLQNKCDSPSSGTHLITDSNNINGEMKSDLGNVSVNLALSQSSQLTQEEQSLVESVFDGIDADSLFDDDFQ